MLRRSGAVLGGARQLKLKLISKEVIRLRLTHAHLAGSADFSVPMLRFRRPRILAAPLTYVQASIVIHDFFAR